MRRIINSTNCIDQDNWCLAIAALYTSYRDYLGSDISQIITNITNITDDTNITVRNLYRYY